MLEMLLDGPHALFGVPAILGTLFFALRVVAGLVGVGMDAADGLDSLDSLDAMDAADAADAIDATDVDPTHADSTGVFKILSIQALTAFAMGFGWGGLLGLHTLERSLPESIGVGALVGAGFAWLVVRLLGLVRSLEASGTVHAADAVGHVARVVVPVPAAGEGRGRVSLALHERTRELDAVSADAPLPIGTQVRVRRVDGARVLVVEPA